jgi:hypothetical protein
VEFHDGESEKERKDRKDGRIEGKTKRGRIGRMGG